MAAAGTIKDTSQIMSPNLSHKQKKQSAMIWISWERQRRSISMAKRLGAEYFEYDYALPAILRYAVSSVRTLYTLVRHRNALVVVQNPSLVLALIAVASKGVFHNVLIVDRHNDPYLVPEGTHTGWLATLLCRASAFTLKQAELTLITNSDLEHFVVCHGGEAFVLPDPLPELGDSPGASPQSLNSKFSLLVSASWAVDEPIAAIVAAAAQLPDVRFYISGKPVGSRHRLPATPPSNVVFTGFLSEMDFYSLMRGVDAVVSITTRYAAIVCGGHEAIVLGKPFITGNNNALKRHFRSAGLYCDGSTSSIQATILYLQSHYRKQTDAVLAFRESYPGEWNASFARLLRRIETLAG
jgi:hypothetical protein